MKAWRYRFAALGVALLVIATPLTAGLGYARVPYTRGTPVTPVETPTYEGLVRAPEFPTDSEWLNTQRPLSVRSLKGKFVLLDFWTYCCINCMHVIPDLKKLEAKYPNELVVIGVHSAKFKNEKQSSAIQNAIRRYQIDHPVINDNAFHVWSSYAVKAWPTFVLINPSGYVIFQESGEQIFSRIDKILSGAVPYFADKGQLDRQPLPRTMGTVASTPLSFPGKISADPKRRRLIVSDTNHNRILVMSPTGEVITVIGSGAKGMSDGPLASATFSHPQGTVIIGEKIYVADTDNHAIRMIDLAKKSVTTVAGNGNQAITPNVAGTGKSVALNSPWDITLVDGRLIIAMAGSHQLWTLNPTTLAVKPYAGSGREGIQDGPLPSALLAQPSGLASDGSDIFIADSEVSGIRKIAADTPFVETLIGKGLFDFGDKDGPIAQAQLQHALGVAYSANTVYVADSYNHKIKEITLDKGRIKTIAGTGKAGFTNGPARKSQLNEPGGLCVIDNILYIADTNNHAIRRLDLRKGILDTLTIKLPQSAKSRSEDGVTMIQLPRQTISDGPVQLSLTFSLPTGLKINSGAPNEIQLAGNPPTVMTTGARFASQWPTIKMSPPHFMLVSDTQPVSGNWEFELTIYTCRTDNGSCAMSRYRINIPYTVTTSGAARLKLTVPLRQ